MNIDRGLEQVFISLSEMKSHAQGVSWIPYGFSNLDHITGGLQKGGLVVIAGRPGVGKTSFALNVSLNVAFSKKSVLYLSMNNSKENLIRRMLAINSEINLLKISHADLTSEEWVALSANAAKLAELPITILDERMDFHTVYSTIMDHKQKQGLDLVILDSMQAMIQDHANANDYHKNYTEMAQSLKDMAKKLDICIVVLSSVSRNVDTRMDKRPQLIDLTYTGTLESESDLIMMLYRDVLYNPECEKPWESELIIAKNNEGPLTTIYLNFIRDCMKFEQ